MTYEGELQIPTIRVMFQLFVCPYEVRYGKIKNLAADKKKAQQTKTTKKHKRNCMK